MVHNDFILYECGVCHTVYQLARIEPLYKCAVCSLNLCPGCDFDGLCQAHHEALKPEDQKMLTKFAEEEDAVRYRARILWWISLILIAIAAFFITIFISWVAMPYPPPLNFTELAWGCAFLSGAVVLYYFRSRVKMQRETIKITIDGILLRYPELAKIMEGRTAMEE